MKALWLFLIVALFVGCGPKESDGNVKNADQGQNTDDALAVLPGGAIAVGTVDARAFFGSQTFGADLAKLVEKYIPIGQEAGFTASKDVDRITFASYAYSGVDVAAIVVGRFDEAKIKAAAASHTSTRGGNVIVASQYLGRDVYTVSNVGFTLLAPDRAVAGTEAGIRRVLERIKDKRVKRDLPQWMIATVETQGAAAAVAADFATNPMPQQTLAQIPVPNAKDLKAARIVATFDQGIKLAAALTFPDEATAQNASQTVKQAGTYTKWLSLIGVRVQNFDVTVEKADVQVKVGVDDQSLRNLVAQAPSWLPPPPQQPQ
jgi:hypothetical protein